MKKTMYSFNVVAIFFLMAMLVSCGGNSVIDPVDVDPVDKYPASFSVTVAFEVPSGYVVTSSSLAIVNNKTSSSRLVEQQTSSNSITVTFTGAEVKNYWNTPVEIILGAGAQIGASYQKGKYNATVTIKDGYVSPVAVLTWR